MPGKYIEFIKAGRFAVPVEITFLPSTIVESDGKEITTSKWMERRHWKETKALLKPAVESALAQNDMPTLRAIKTQIVEFGHEICLGYMLQCAKDNTAFMAVLDAKNNCWTDDEEESDPYSDLGDYGGRFKNYTTTKVHIVACVLKKTVSNLEDSKRVRKELGLRTDDLRSYFQQSNLGGNNPGPSTSGSYDRFHQTDFGGSSNDKTSCSDLLSSFDTYCAATKLSKKSRYSQKPKGYAKATSAWKSKSAPRRNDRFWNRPYLNNKDDDDDTLESDDGSSDPTSDASTDSNVFEKRISSETNDADDDDDDFSLPDIDSPIKPVPAKKPRVYKRNTALQISASKWNTNSYHKDLYTSSDVSKTSRSKKKAPSLNYMGFSSPTSQSFEEAIGTSMYRTSHKKKTSSTSLYAGTKSPKKVQKTSDSTGLRGRNKKNMSTSDSPSKTVNSFQTDKDEFLHPTFTTESFRRKSQSPVLGDANFVASPFYYSSKKHTSFNHSNNGLISSVLQGSTSSSSITSVDSSGKSASSSVGGFERVLTVAAKKSFDEQETVVEEEKQKKRKASTPVVSKDATNSPTKPKKQKSLNKIKELQPHLSHSTENGNKDSSDHIVTYDPDMPVLDKMVDNDINSNDVSSECGTSRAPLLSSVYATKSSFSVQPSSPKKSNPLSSIFSFDYSTVPMDSSTPKLDVPSSTAIVSTEDTGTSTLKKKKKKKHKHKTNKESKMHKADKASPQQNTFRTSDTVVAIITNPDKVGGINGLDTESYSSKLMQSKKHLLSLNDHLLSVKEKSVAVGSIDGNSKSTNSSLSKHRDASTSTTADAQLDEVVIEILRQNAVINYEVGEPDKTDDTTVVIAEFSGSIGEKRYGDMGSFIPRANQSRNEYSDDDDEKFFDKTIYPLCASHREEGSYHMPAFGPTDDYADKDLFCFHDKPSTSQTSKEVFSVPVVANNRVSTATNTEDDEAISMPPPTKRPPRSPKKPLESSRKTLLQDTSRIPGADIPENCIQNTVESIIEGRNKTMSTYQLLTTPSVLRQGMEYLQKLSSNKMTVEEVNAKLGIGIDNEEEEPNEKLLMPPPKFERELSPDICCLTSDVKCREAGKGFKNTSVTRPSRSRRRQKDKVGSNEDGLDVEITPKVEVESEVEDNAGHELVRELISRCATETTPEEDAHNEETLSQRSVCMTNFVSGYAQKSAMYKKNSLKVQNLTMAELIENFNCVRHELKGIYEGIVSSPRHSLYLEGLSETRKSLKELNISIPFTSQQGMYLSSFINDYLIPNSEERLQFIEYISFVMLPEALIRIYARVTDQTYEKAQLEMRFGACYDESTPE